ncbi:MAG: thiamine pyrophosphate-binding protein [Thermodesulfobacteriota bacterium]
MAMMSGGKALVELLRREGVEYVFGIPGATEILFMNALREAPEIRYVLGLHEVVCAGMAEGYARASGKVGFLNLHTGPGVAAALPMLYNAQSGGVPLVVTAGQNHTRLLQYDPHLSGDIVGMGKLYTKWSTEIVHAEDIPATIQRAFKMALQHPAGPVLVSIPQNVLEQQFDFRYKPNTRVYTQVRPDKAALDSALAILREAKRPIILVESGVTRCGALDEVVRFAELTGSRVYQSWMSDVNFPVTHPQYLGDLDPTSPPAKGVFKDADVVIGIGCSLFAQAFFNPEPTLPPGIRVIHVDENPWEIGKNFPADCGILGDIKAALEELNERIEREMPSAVLRDAERRAGEIGREKSGLTEKLNKQIESERENVPISISRLMAEIKEAIGPDTVVVDECWSASGMLRQVLDLSKPKTFFRGRKGGSIGWGLPGALGVKLGLPDKPVIAVCGDGSAAWSMQSLWTAARYRIPVTFVITNNATYRQVKLVRKLVLGDYPLNEKHEGMELDNPVMDFTMLARSMGVQAEAVRDPGDLGLSLKAAVESGEPRLVEVFTENRP